MHDTLLALAQSFRAQGYDLYLVGGTVRDLLLHRDSPPDADLTTNARPDDIKRLVAPTRPLVVVTVGEQFGTVRLHYPRADESESSQEAASGPEPVAIANGRTAEVDVVEITTYRSDRYDPSSRKPEVTFGDNLEGDLLRRDFTINAMARDPLSGAIIDPSGGREDLERNVMPAVADHPRPRLPQRPARTVLAPRASAP